jgi:histone-lysine N-methyltransferase SETMAR
MESCFFTQLPYLLSTYHSSKAKSQSLGGKMMHPASHYQGTRTRLKEAVCHKRPELLSLLHDNAWPHTASTTVNLLNTRHWKILPHPPYSSDLAPLDFDLFPKLKKQLQGLHIQTDEAVQEDIKRWLCVQDISFYHQGFDSLIFCYDKCFNSYGDYVKKQTAYMPISNPCVTSCNLFIFQIKNREPYLQTSCPIYTFFMQASFKLFKALYHKNSYVAIKQQTPY